MDSITHTHDEKICNLILTSSQTLNINKHLNKRNNDDPNDSKINKVKRGLLFCRVCRLSPSARSSLTEHQQQSRLFLWLLSLHSWSEAQRFQLMLGQQISHVTLSGLTKHPRMSNAYCSELEAVFTNAHSRATVWGWLLYAVWHFDIDVTHNTA